MKKGRKRARATRGLTGFAAAAAVWLSSSVGTCHAWLITVGIAADVTEMDDRSGLLQGKVSIGAIIEGTYTYDTSAPDTRDAPNIGEYRFSCTPCGIALQVGGFVFKTDPNSVDFIVTTVNDGPGIVDTYDRFRLDSSQNVGLDHDISVRNILIWLEDSYC